MGSTARRLPLVVVFAVVVTAACGDPASDGSAAATTQSDNAVTTTASSSPTTAAPTTSTDAPTTTPDLGGDELPTISVPDIDELLAGTEFADSGIDHRCLSEPAPGVPSCTQVTHDPSGVPVSWDSATRTLTRHADDGTEATAVLGASFAAASLVEAGPHEVVYLNVVNEPGAEGSADLVAVALAPGDAGREIAREVGAGNPGGDFDLVAVPSGITTTDWYGQGPRPDPSGSIMMPWIVRDPDSADLPASGVDALPGSVDEIRINAYERTVTVNGRTWELTGDSASISPTGMPAIERTFDGGFIARYDEVVGEYRTIVVRGWPDGSVNEWIAPPDPNGFHGLLVIPEPMGSVLAASGDRFVRLYPFGVAPAAWDVDLDVDVEAARVDVTALNDHLAGLDGPQPRWDTDVIAFADAVLGPVWSPIELRTISVVEQGADTTTVVVTNSNFPDDSVFAARYTIEVRSDLRRVEQISWQNRCQPNRGHQTFEADLCL
jgi:hypothetical protein